MTATLMLFNSTQTQMEMIDISGDTRNPILIINEWIALNKRTDVAYAIVETVRVTEMVEYFLYTIVFKYDVLEIKRHSKIFKLSELVKYWIAQTGFSS
jgi:hypothetical protein